MLSKIDLENEIWKGINIYHFSPENIKENSINFTASKYAWSLSEQSITLGKKQYSIKRGGTSVIQHNGKDLIVVLPFSTSLIETEEVLALDGRIGGTYHSKVGIVSKGFGHIGTMVGPKFSGHSLIALHNISKEIKTIEVGETFLSIVFYYVKTPIQDKNPTIGAHLDKMSELGINLESSDRQFLGEDWKSQIDEVREKLVDSDEYKNFSKKKSRRKFKNIKAYFTKRNAVIVFIMFLLIVSVFCGSYVYDEHNKTNFFSMFLTVGFSGFMIYIIKFFTYFLKK